MTDRYRRKAAALKWDGGALSERLGHQKRLVMNNNSAISCGRSMATDNRKLYYTGESQQLKTATNFAMSRT